VRSLCGSWASCFFWLEGFEISSCKSAFFWSIETSLASMSSKWKFITSTTSLWLLQTVLFKLDWINVLHVLSVSLPHAVNYRRFCFWRRQSCVFFVCVWNVLGNYPSDKFEDQGQRDSHSIFRPFQQPTRSLFGKTSLASSIILRSKVDIHWVLYCNVL